jgi:hypothetical protein
MTICGHVCESQSTYSACEEEATSEESTSVESGIQVYEIMYPFLIWYIRCA